MTQSSNINDQISSIIAEMSGQIAPATVKNAMEFLIFAETFCGPPQGVGRGYWPTLTFSWAGFEFEIFPERIEFYRFMKGWTNIREHTRSPGMPFPESLIADLVIVAGSDEVYPPLKLG